MHGNVIPSSEISVSTEGAEEGKRAVDAILVDDPVLSCSTSGESGDNRLIFGDNLPALEALATEFSGRIRCIYGDPPYNANAAVTHYEDSIDHDAWLSFMRSRLIMFHRLLRRDGSMFLHLDDNEIDYMKVVADEIFGRDNFISRITVEARAPSAFSTVNPGLFKASEYILWYARDRAAFRENTMRIPRAPDTAYNKWLVNPDDPCERWTFISLLEAYRIHAPRPPGQPLRSIKHFERFVIRNAARICRLATISDSGAGRAILVMKERSSRMPGVVLRHPRKEYDDVYVLDGKQLVFYAKNVVLIDGELTASAPLTNIWTDIAWEGIAGEGGVSFKKGKKPERLLRRCLDLASEPGDWVLDAFAGSGTTGAVAHKMGRRWIMIEKGVHCRTHILPRLLRVISGTDPTGVSAVTEWSGGGGFRFQTVEKKESDPTL